MLLHFYFNVEFCYKGLYSFELIPGVEAYRIQTFDRQNSPGYNFPSEMGLILIIFGFFSDTSEKYLVRLINKAGKV